MQPTFQDILKNRSQKNFVGRSRERVFFRQNLKLELDDCQRCFILNVFGQGGVGKSTLLKVYREYADKEGWITTWADRANEDLPEVINRLAMPFENTASVPYKKFRKKYERLLDNRQTLEADPDFVEGFAGSAGSLLGRTGVLLARCTAGPLLDGIDANEVGDRTRDLGAFLARKFKNDKKDVQLMRDPIAVLTPIFLEGLSTIAEEQSVALFFDEYERSVSQLDEWLRDLLTGQYGGVPGNLLFVIAGRQELDRNSWGPFDDLMKRASLEPFAPEESREYLTSRGIESREDIRLIRKLSGGLPLLMATLAAGERSDVGAVGEACDTAVERFLLWVESRERRDVAIDAAIPRLINRDVVTEIVLFSEGTSDSKMLFDWLIRMPFVNQHEEGWVYHDVVRQQMLRHARRISPIRWKQLQECFADSAAKRRDQICGENEEPQMQNETWQSLHLDHLYHKLCADPSKALPEVVSAFLDALMRQRRRLARRWAVILWEAGRDSEAEELETLGTDLKRFHAKKTTDQEKLQTLRKITDRVPLDARHLCAVLELRASTLWRLDLHQESLDDLDRMLELAPELPAEDYRNEMVAKVLFSKGVILCAIDRHEEAIAVYDNVVRQFGDREESSFIELVARALVNKGVSLGELDHHEEALTTYADVSRRLAGQDDLLLSEQLAKALVNRGATLGRLEQYEEAITAYDAVSKQYGQRAEPSLAELVVKALSNKATILSALEEHEQAIATYDTIKQQYSDYDMAPINELVASSHLNRGYVLIKLGLHEEAASAFDMIEDLYGDHKEPPIIRTVASALFSKGVALSLLDRYQETILIYDRVAENHVDSDDDSLAKLASWAFLNKAIFCSAKGSKLKGGTAEQESAWQQAEEAFVAFSEQAGVPLTEVYDYACYLALRGREGDALKTLETCLNEGTATLESVHADSEWDALRSTPAFLELLAFSVSDQPTPT